MKSTYTGAGIACIFIVTTAVGLITLIGNSKSWTVFELVRAYGICIVESIGFVAGLHFFCKAEEADRYTAFMNRMQYKKAQSEQPANSQVAEEGQKTQKSAEESEMHKYHTYIKWQ